MAGSMLAGELWPQPCLWLCTKAAAPGASLTLSSRRAAAFSALAPALLWLTHFCMLQLSPFSSCAFRDLLSKAHKSKREEASQPLRPKPWRLSASAVAGQRITRCSHAHNLISNQAAKLPICFEVPITTAPAAPARAQAPAQGRGKEERAKKARAEGAKKQRGDLRAQLR